MNDYPVMIRGIEISDYPRLMKIWEDSVLNTHDFLKKEDFLFYQNLIEIRSSNSFQSESKFQRPSSESTPRFKSFGRRPASSAA